MCCWITGRRTCVKRRLWDVSEAQKGSDSSPMFSDLTLLWRCKESVRRRAAERLPVNHITEEENAIPHLYLLTVMTLGDESTAGPFCMISLSEEVLGRPWREPVLGNTLSPPSLSLHSLSFFLFFSSLSRCLPPHYRNASTIITFWIGVLRWWRAVGVQCFEIWKVKKCCAFTEKPKNNSSTSNVYKMNYFPDTEYYCCQFP